MGTLKVRIRYLETRTLADGTTAYYWINRKAAKAGMVNETLGTDPVQAQQRAKALNELWDAIRAGKVAPSPTAAVHGTLAWWLDRIEASDDHKARPTKGQKEVEGAFKILRGSPLGRLRLADVTGEQIRKFHRRLAEAKSIDVGHRTCKWLRFALNLAVQAKHIPGNPMLAMRLQRPAPRYQFWTEDEVAQAVAKAHEIGRPSLARAFQLSYDIGQRPGDVRMMRTAAVDGGDILVRQSKTGAIVRIQMLPELAAALADAPRDTLYLIISEETQRPYEFYNFAHWVAAVIKATGIEGKTYQDLRRSAVVRLALAGCTIPEICGVTGHSFQRCTAILETYLPRTTEAARNAITKLLEHRERQATKGERA